MELYGRIEEIINIPSSYTKYRLNSTAVFELNPMFHFMDHYFEAPPKFFCTAVMKIAIEGSINPTKLGNQLPPCITT